MSSLTADAARSFADEWIAAWNSHDLDRILSHYALDVVFLSPVAQKRVGNGRVVGHAGLRAYWGPALAGIKDLHFTLINVFTGHDALTIQYRNQLGEVTETFELGADGKVIRSMACYAG
jgi:ketosteroid isomerase-like protein